MIKKCDMYPYNPETAIVFNKKKVYTTIVGGAISILMFFTFTYLWYYQFYMMLNYQKNTIVENIVTPDIASWDPIPLSEMNTLPFVAPYYKGQEIPRFSISMCG